MADFPPLASSSGSLPLPSSSPLDWKNLLATTPQVSTTFSHSLSFVPAKNLTAKFSPEQFVAGAAEWSLSLVGYSIGKRPFYEALLSTIKKTWKLKGEFSLLTMDDGFFLLKFSALEDYELAWNGGPWFFFGKPFILQKWTPDFIPKREEFPSIPLWIKIWNLPLSLWTPEGISKLASCVGIPLAVDALTVAKTRLTFARICVQVTSSSPFPEEIYYSVDDKTFPLRVQYDWKPESCSQCGSIMHPPSLCPKDPIIKPPAATKPRGKTSSRKPRLTPPPRLQIPKPPAIAKPDIQQQTHLPNLLHNIPSEHTIPNLNSPSNDPVANPEQIITRFENPPISTSKNKFLVLADDDPVQHTQNQTNLISAEVILANQNINSPPHTSPRNHHPTIPTNLDQPSSSSNSTKTQQSTQQNHKQTRGKNAKKPTNPKCQ